MAAAEVCRFNVLLNPIRDLAANWGIDVAKELSEYAESLGIDINERDATEQRRSFNSDHSTAPIDFAEAALLVQGSTSIYSRKVEHLYSLVYHAVSELNQYQEKEKAAGNGSSSPKHKGSDADALLSIDQVNFWTLDSHVQVADPKAISLPKQSLPPIGSLQDLTCQRPIPPMLIQNGLDNSDNLARVNYKIPSAHVHSSGALIMQGCPPVSENLDKLPNGLPVPEVEHDFHFSDENDRDMETSEMDNEPVGFGMTTPPAFSRALSFEGEDQVVAIATSARKRALRDPAPVDAKFESKPKQDPFLLLDPHEEMTSFDKPLRIGKTYRRPRKFMPQNDFLSVYDEEVPPEMDLADMVLGPIPNGASLKRYICHKGILNQYRGLMRRRTAQKRKATLFEKKFFSLGDIENGLEEGFEKDIPHVFFGEDDADDFDDDEIDFNPPEFNKVNSAKEDPNVVSNENDDYGTKEKTGRRLSDHLVNLASSYELACRKHLEKTSWMWEQHAVDSKLVKKVDEWTARIQPLLDDEQHRPEFDITSYGKKILQTFIEKGIESGFEETTLSKIIQTSEKYEVARMFLATLQLANSYSVQISSPRDCIVGDPCIKLLAQNHSTPTGKVLTPRPRSKRSREIVTPNSLRRRPIRPKIQT